MKKYYIYVFLDGSKPGKFIYDDIEFEYEPFYVGKGTGDRIKTSLYDRESPFKVNKIKKIKKIGGEIISVKLYENLENEESLEMEKYVIKKIGRRDLGLGTLVNQTDGGDGRLTSPHSNETKLKISNTKKSQHLHSIITDDFKEYLREINTGSNNPMFGKHHSEKTKEEHSLRVSGVNHPMFGKKHNEETINKIKERRNKSNIQERLNKISTEVNSKVVLQFSLDGDFISEYESIKIASEKTGCSESIIGKCCRGVIKNPRKFIFRFKDENSKILNNSYRYKLGDIFEMDGKTYKLIKRNKMSCIVSIDDVIESIRKKDCLFLWQKNII
jgi:group I intron endonuclease